MDFDCAGIMLKMRFFNSLIFCRGIFPRAMEELFAAYEGSSSDVRVQFSVSAFEIYKGEVYDLLNCDVTHSTGPSLCQLLIGAAQADENCEKLPGRENRHMRTLVEMPTLNSQQANSIVLAGQARRRYVCSRET